MNKKIIDVSHWNDQQMVYKKIANYNEITGIMIKIGEYSQTHRKMVKDSKFDIYYTMALNAGLDIGCYYFSKATTQEESVYETKEILSLTEDYFFSLPICGDYETSRYTQEKMDEIIAPAGIMVEQAGYYFMAYMDKDNYSRVSKNLKDRYGFWVASWNTSPSSELMKWENTPGVKMWQYTSTGVEIGGGDIDCSALLYNLPQAILQNRLYNIDGARKRNLFEIYTKNKINRLERMV